MYRMESVASAKAMYAGIVSGEIVPWSPNTANQWRVRISLRGQSREPCEKLPAAMRVDSLSDH